MSAMQMDGRTDGQAEGPPEIAVVTAAGSGIGRAVTVELLRAGCSVAPAPDGTWWTPTRAGRSCARRRASR